MRLKFTFLTLALVQCALLWAQPARDNNRLNSVANIAFIKNTEEPFPADSITLRTSLDTFPYGFAFRQDTVVLDVNIFPPVDELTIELLSGGQSFGRSSFWVDAPSANVYLSVKEKRTEVDSVTLSGVDTWWRNQLSDLRGTNGLLFLSQKLVDLTFMTSGDLMGATFASALVDLPNVSSGTIYELREGLLPGLPPLLKRHPRYQKLAKRIKLIGKRPARLNRLGFFNADGKPVRVKFPQGRDMYVLELYSTSDPRSRQAHQQIATVPELDSLFTQVAPMVSISTDPSPALWRLYVTDNEFGWPHYVEDPKAPERLSTQVAGPVYLLMNRQDRVSASYYSLQSLVNAVRWRSRK